jgi:hypothetical protein
MASYWATSLQRAVLRPDIGSYQDGSPRHFRRSRLHVKQAATRSQFLYDLGLEDSSEPAPPSLTPPPRCQPSPHAPQYPCPCYHTENTPPYRPRHPLYFNPLSPDFPIATLLPRWNFRVIRSVPLLTNGKRANINNSTNSLKQGMFDDHIPAPPDASTVFDWVRTYNVKTEPKPKRPVASVTIPLVVANNIR